MRNSKLAAIAAATVLSIGLTGCAVTEQGANPQSSVSQATQAPTAANTPLPSVDVTAQPNETGVTSSTKIAPVDQQAELLQFLIEEEKLAHDVYLSLSELWGSKVFSNILQSEIGHQGQVLTLLAARSIDDPRASEVGVFVNEGLQKLYDELLAKGSKSMTDAFEVGVAIEELDIADITRMLGQTLDSDVIATLERLRSASENHLRAFNRQL